MALDKVLSSSIANGAVTAALISNTANLVVSSLTANVITITTISGSANVTGDMTVGGNLTISGTTTYVNTTDLNIGDAIISLNADLAANVAPTENAGLNINRGASTNAQFVWVESTDNWSLGNTSIGGTLATTSNTVTLGTAAYFVANGNVGMGTDSPAYRLDVNGDLKVVNAVRYFVGATQYGVTFANAGAVGTEAYQGTYIYWGTGASTSATERMRLDASGNLGLGVTPSTSTSNYRTLQIGGSAKFSIFGQRVGGACETLVGWNIYGGSNTTTVGTGYYYTNTGDAATLYTQTDNHRWWIAPSGTAGANVAFTQAMTLDASGNLVVGNSTAWSRFHVTKSVNNTNTAATNITDYQNAAFILHNQDDAGTGNKAGMFFAFAGSPGLLAGMDGYKVSGTWDTGLRWYTNNQTGGNTGTLYERMRIAPDGRVGIGVTSPTWKLEVEGNQESLASFRPSSNTSAGYARFINGGGTFYIGIDSSTGGRISGSGLAYAASMTTEGNTALTFGTNNTNRMTIDTTGQLLVGTTTSAGAVSNTKRIVGGSFSSFNGVLNSVSSGVAYTLFTMTADFTSYMVTVSALVSTAAYSETAIVHLNNTSVNVIVIAGGSAIAIQNTGMAVQVVQSSGATVSELLWSAMRIT